MRHGIRNDTHCHDRARSGSQTQDLHHSGSKGGVGVTTLAVNFAGVLAQRKKTTYCLTWTGRPTMQPCRLARRLSTHAGSRREPRPFGSGVVLRVSSLATLSASSWSVPPTQRASRVFSPSRCYANFTSFLVRNTNRSSWTPARHLADELVLGSLQSSTTVSCHYTGIPRHPQRGSATSRR